MPTEESIKLAMQIARTRAMEVIDLWIPPAPQVVRDYLTTGDPEIRMESKMAAFNAARKAMKKVRTRENKSDHDAWKIAQSAANAAFHASCEPSWSASHYSIERAHWALWKFENMGKRNQNDQPTGLIQ